MSKEFKDPPWWFWVAILAYLAFTCLLVGIHYPPPDQWSNQSVRNTSRPLDAR